MNKVPLLPGVLQLAQDGFFTGASGRNWDAYGKDVELGDAITPAQRALLTDPQTSGGLLVSCDPDSVDAVLALFAREGFGDAAVIGAMAEGAPRVTVALALPTPSTYRRPCRSAASSPSSSPAAGSRRGAGARSDSATALSTTSTSKRKTSAKATGKGRTKATVWLMASPVEQSPAPD